MWLSFTRPEYLLLVPLAGVLLWLSARASYADLRGRRLLLAWSARGLLMLCLVMALAGAQLVKRGKGHVVTFVLDRSVSVPITEQERGLEYIREALKSRRPDQRGALVVFGRDAVVETESLRRPEDVKVTSVAGQAHTSISAGLRLALGLLPPESAGRIVLLSDGNENIGSATAEALAASAAGVPVDVVVLDSRSEADALVQDVNLVSEARSGEPVPLTVRVQATRPTQTEVTVLVDDSPVQRQAVDLAGGKTTLNLSVRLDEPGFHKVDVLLNTPGDRCNENNVGTGFVRVAGKPRVLLVGGDAEDTRHLAESLRAQDVSVQTGGPAALPTNAAELEGYDSLILANCPAYKMGEGQMAMYRDAVRDLGIGLGVSGGEFSFGAGGYYETAIEEALPLSMEVRKERGFPASAVVVVMDTSGSMGMIEDGVEKIQLAAEAAVSIVELLQAQDSVGVIASDPRPSEVCALRKVGSKSSLIADIRSLRAGGGGLSVFPSLQAAYSTIGSNKSPIRHVIILADGSDCDEQEGSVPLAAEMSTQRITVTTIAFGDGPHVPFLKQVAKAGKGNYYLTERAHDLKKVFTREALTIAKSVLMETKFRPAPAESSEVIQGLDWQAVPPLLGYVATTSKPLATVPLRAPKSDPLFAHWQYGLGRSIGFTSDASAHWAAHWLGWGEFRQFWGQAVRWSMRQPGHSPLYPAVERRGDRSVLTVDAVAEDGELLNGLDVWANLNRPDGTRERAQLIQIAPGRYQVETETAAAGAYVAALTATGPGGMQTLRDFGFSIAYPPDLADTRRDEAFLTSLAAQTAGRVLTAPEQAFAPPASMPRVSLEIWRALLWIAAFLLPLDVAVRRLVVTREDVQAIVAPAAAWIGALWGRRPAVVNRRPVSTARVLMERLEDRSPQAERPPIVMQEDARARAAAQQTPAAQEPTPAPEPLPASPGGERTTSRLLERKRQMRDGDS